MILVFESRSISSKKEQDKKEDNNLQNKVYDIAVIGSGPGGAIAALRSIEAGKSVVLIESGSFYPPGTIEHHSLNQTNNQFKDQGMSFCYGNIPILFAEGSTYGGGSEVNSGLYLSLIHI